MNLSFAVCARGNNPRSRRRTAFLSALLMVASLAVAMTLDQHSAAAAGSSCGATINPIACENSQTAGVVNDTVWDVSGSGDSTIQGFSTDISVNAGSTIGFKINTPASAYAIDIYRLGYYGGAGARKWASITPSAKLPQVQPACATDPSTSLYDCGTWGLSASWAVPATAVSGVYIAHLTRTDTGGESLITFIVRNDASTADIVYQTSDPTWEAYNRYGGADFYTGDQQNLFDSPTRARKLSYNRPFATRDDNGGRDFLFSNEFPTIQFLEQNGYDMTYISGVDTDRYGATQLLNHKVFLSVGHDEYWSQAQRTNVENARNHGVSLMFLSGNEVYWHTRYEPSIDGSNTPYRTLVDYKETWDNAPTDPTGEATATWRDPNYSLAPGGSNPENGLTGTMYLANSDDLPLTVPATQAKDRLWRNTGLSTTTSNVLAQHTVGYESDEDVDNGSRPAGLIDVSTTVGSTPQLLQDFGNVTVPGTTTHSMTLYKAPSGALVFGAGTIQYAWGLSTDHDGPTSTVSKPMQQAVINMLADMKAQPSTLMSGLVAATASTDTNAPTSTITSPANNAAIGNGASITVTGTAADTGGGVVAGVEVSIDGGTTWHPATGTTSWSYTGIIHGDTPTKILSRATDDSANTETPGPGVTVNTACPCSVFGAAVPTVTDSGDASSYQLGMAFKATENGVVTGVRFYKSAANTGTHTGTLWTSTGTSLATGTFTNETASGWQTMTFTSPVSIIAGTTYVVSYYVPNGHYAADPYYFYYDNAAKLNSAPLQGIQNSPTNWVANGLYSDGNAFPTQSVLGTNYYVDVLFTGSGATTPSVTQTTPNANATGVLPTATPSATFSKPMSAATITYTLKTSTGTTVAGTVTYDTASQTATFTPSAVLAYSTTYTATVNGQDTSGNPMAAAYVWSFTTEAACPCTLFNNMTPATVDSGDTGAVNLGLKFVPSVSGYIWGVRFYKAATNTGVHVGTLWSASGTQLAQATFANETASGWQTVNFSAGVAVTAGVTYVVSYFTPTGHYSADSAFFASPFTYGALTAPAGTNGVYLYGTTTAFPTSTVNSTNYWVDPVFSTSPPTNTTPPTVTSTSPVSGSTNVATSIAPTATFSTALNQASLVFTLTNNSTSAAVAGSVSYNSTTYVATFTPTAALAQGVSYTASVQAADTSGNAMPSATTWTFTTAPPPIVCPCTLFASNATPANVDSGDTSAVNLGVKFSPTQTGFITGMRFYKAATNTGTHVGTLWSATGTQLAQATFTNETASGWQSVTFATPVAVAAGATYVVSYLAPVGHYSYDSAYFAAALSNPPLTAPAGTNGVYAYSSATTFPASSYQNSNYWVDPIFNTTATGNSTPPTVTSTAPAAGTAGVAPSTAVSATFSEPVNTSSIIFTLTGPGSTVVAGTVSYSASTETATFTPTAALASSTTYTASVTAADTFGNAMATPTTWTFSTSTGICPCTLFASNAAPANVDSGDVSAVNLGVLFTPSQAGSITGIRFYKAATNTGTHVGTLWTLAGTSLGTVTFTNETTSGWQTATFASPIAVAAATTYVISYSAPNGHYSYDPSYFTKALTNGPLTAPAGANGVYAYGTATAFPASTYQSTNYWVDPIFSLSAAEPVISGVAASSSGATSANVTWTTDETSTSVVNYGTSATTLNLSATTAGSVTAHTVPLTGLAAATTYYYRITSVDAAANSATSPVTTGAPLTFTTAAAVTITDATTANFALGTTSSTYVTSDGAGSVVLNPTAVQEFSGTALPTGWTSTANVTGGSSVVSGGSVKISGANLTTTATYASGSSLEVLATLNKAQTIGFVSTASTTRFMRFSVNSSNQLVAAINDGTTANTATSAALVTGWSTTNTTAHKFRIEWTATTVTFYLDDVSQYTHNFGTTLGNSYEPLFADTSLTDQTLSVDWARIGPYAATGTFTSRIFDDGSSTAVWGALSWIATLPAGTTMTVSVRTGNTAIPDATWSAWAAVSTSGSSVGATARYLQYQVTLTTTTTGHFVTPTLTSVSAVHT